ncbi:hypothetical protein GTQ34_01190 [Muricauda sp. JGD-17]|uniref:Uncharacterized protein n=1 Tax=Flagellimonas ochracea TaxID=2696472 RepID=A0A964WW79_9FLAO|nr:hypothetical protein [Allomuricauda ochracea]NAY90518.1 hypothetical protein [Allomuricauda ochracea]
MSLVLSLSGVKVLSRKEQRNVLGGNASTCNPCLGKDLNDPCFLNCDPFNPGQCQDPDNDKILTCQVF